jgi:hypothetical protein
MIQNFSLVVIPAQAEIQGYIRANGFPFAGLAK